MKFEEFVILWEKAERAYKLLSEVERELGNYPTFINDVDPKIRWSAIVDSVEYIPSTIHKISQNVIHLLEIQKQMEGLKKVKSE